MPAPLLRQSSPADGPFIYAVYEATARVQVEDAGRKWLGERMREKASQEAADTSTRIVECEGVECGFFGVEVGDTEIRVQSLFLLPEYQRRGIGNRLMSIVLSEANERGLPISLHVATYNPARAFYERLGFAVQEEMQGHYLMRRGAA